MPFANSRHDPVAYDAPFWLPTPNADDTLAIHLHPAAHCRLGEPVKYEPIHEQDAHHRRF